MRLSVQWGFLASRWRLFVPLASSFDIGPSCIRTFLWKVRVMPTKTPLFDAWRQAEQAASAAEHELYALMVRVKNTGETRHLREQGNAVKLLRQRAHVLFDDAMREMKSLADSLHHRVLDDPGAVQSGEWQGFGGSDDAADGRLNPTSDAAGGPRRDSLAASATVRARP